MSRVLDGLPAAIWRVAMWDHRRGLSASELADDTVVSLDWDLRSTIFTFTVASFVMLGSAAGGLVALGRNTTGNSAAILHFLAMFLFAYPPLSGLALYGMAAVLCYRNSAPADDGRRPSCFGGIGSIPNIWPVLNALTLGLAVGAGLIWGPSFR
jgi:hypothetical protein